MIKMLDLVSPKTLVCETEEKQLPEEFKVRDKGLEFLKGRIEHLNKKATKYKVPPLTIKIVSEDMVKEIHPDIKRMQMSQPVQMALDKSIIDDPNSWVLVKEYTVKLEGTPPHIDGYEFIARLEHTDAGNFIYTNPKASIGNLPSEFKTLNQRCDFCKTLRDRNDTFVVRMEQDDPKRFPEKKSGDLLVIGRNCLAAFMPGISVSSIIAYTRLIESIREDVAAAKEMEEKGEYSGGSGKYYEDPEHLLRFLVATYLHTGFYMSKKQAQANYDAGKENNSTSTLSRALSEMRPNPWAKHPETSYPVHYRLKQDEAFEAKVVAMCEEFANWLPTKDWDAIAAEKPNLADFIHNLKLVASQDYLRGNHFGFFSALFQWFLRDKGDMEKKAETAKQIAAFQPSPVKFDETLLKKLLKDIAKETEIKRLLAGGLDEKAIKKQIRGKEWGWEVECKKISEYEKTNAFGGMDDSSIGYRIALRDNYGNDFLWFAGNNPGFVEGNKYIIDGAVVGYEATNKYTNRTQTRINRVRILKDMANPTAPPQAEPPPTTEPNPTA